MEEVKRGYHIINRAFAAMPHINRGSVVKNSTRWGRFCLWLHNESDLKPIYTFGGGGRGIRRIVKEGVVEEGVVKDGNDEVMEVESGGTTFSVEFDEVDEVNSNKKGGYSITIENRGSVIPFDFVAPDWVDMPIKIDKDGNPYFQQVGDVGGKSDKIYFSNKQFFAFHPLILPNSNSC